MSETPRKRMRIGRPPVFETHETFQAAVDAYFDDCDERSAPYTMSGLALALGIGRTTLMNYEHRDPVFMNTVKQARARVECEVEEQLLTRDKQVAGHIFNLKNNFGWRDTQEIEHTHNVVRFGVAPPPVLTITEERVGETLSLSEGRSESGGSDLYPALPAVLVSGEGA